MIVINRGLILDRDTTFDGDVRVSGMIIGTKYTLTVKGELICSRGDQGGFIMVKELNVSEDVHAGVVVAQKASARNFIGGALIAKEIVGQTISVWHVEKVDE